MQGAYAAALKTSALLDAGSSIATAPRAFVTGTSTAEVNINATGSLDGLPTSATFIGTARSSADYGTLKTYINASLNNYPHWSYSTLWDMGNGEFSEEPGQIGTASATIEDSLTVNSSVNGLMEVSFTIDGATNILSEYFGLTGYTSFRAKTNGNWIYNDIFYTDVNTTISVTIPYLSDTPTDILFNLFSGIDIQDGDFSVFSDPYSVNPIMDFSNTVTLSEILITDINGAPITGASITADSGYAYPVSMLNAVPIPAAVWLFGSGLVGLIGVARRKKS